MWEKQVRATVCALKGHQPRSAQQSPRETRNYRSGKCPSRGMAYQHCSCTEKAADSLPEGRTWGIFSILKFIPHCKNGLLLFRMSKLRNMNFLGKVTLNGAYRWFGGRLGGWGELASSYGMLQQGCTQNFDSHTSYITFHMDLLCRDLVLPFPTLN